NLPLGAIALLVISAVFRSREEPVRAAIDYLGAVLMTIALTALVVFLSLGGTTLPWGSWTSLALLGSGLVLAGWFLVQETRADEPILPLELFRERVFSVACAVGFVGGVAMIGSTTYMPVFLQIVKGESPTRSGILLA